MSGMPNEDSGNNTPKKERYIPASLDMYRTVNEYVAPTPESPLTTNFSGSLPFTPPPGQAVDLRQVVGRGGDIKESFRDEGGKEFFRAAKDSAQGVSGGLRGFLYDMAAADPMNPQVPGNTGLATYLQNNPSAATWFMSYLKAIRGRAGLNG